MDRGDCPVRSSCHAKGNNPIIVRVEILLVELVLSEIIDYAEDVHDRVDILHVIDSAGENGCLFVVVGNAPLGDLLPKVDDEKVREKSSPNWVSEILPVPGIGQMFQRKWSHFGVLLKLVHSRHCLYERKELEITQTDVDTTEFAYLGSKILGGHFSR